MKRHQSYWCTALSTNIFLKLLAFQQLPIVVKAKHPTELVGHVQVDKLFLLRPPKEDRLRAAQAVAGRLELAVFGSRVTVFSFKT